MINNKIKTLLKKQACKSIITDLRIGLKYCCVELDYNKLGVATLKSFLEREISGDHLSGRLYINETSDRLLDLLGDSSFIDSSIALATLNALVNPIYGDNKNSGILDIVTCNPDDYVAMIGYNQPLAIKIKQQTNYLYIFEQTPTEDFLPIEQIENLIHEFKVIFISADFIIDNSIDVLLNISDLCLEKVIVGVSTPFLPEVFREYNVTALSGVQVLDNDKCKKFISHGFVDIYKEEYIKISNIKI